MVPNRRHMQRALDIYLASTYVPDSPCIGRIKWKLARVIKSLNGHRTEESDGLRRSACEILSATLEREVVDEGANAEIGNMFDELVFYWKK